MNNQIHQISESNYYKNINNFKNTEIPTNQSNSEELKTDEKNTSNNNNIYINSNTSSNYVNTEKYSNNNFYSARDLIKKKFYLPITDEWSNPNKMEFNDRVYLQNFIIFIFLNNTSLI